MLACRRLPDIKLEGTAGILFCSGAISGEQEKEEYRSTAPCTEEAATQCGSHHQGVCETAKS
jgi:hypothetical protein